MHTGFEPGRVYKVWCAAIAHGFYYRRFCWRAIASARLGSEYNLYPYKPILLERSNTIYSMWSHYSFLFGDFSFFRPDSIASHCALLQVSISPRPGYYCRSNITVMHAGFEPGRVYKVWCASVAHGFIVDVSAEGTSRLRTSGISKTHFIREIKYYL